VIILEKTLLENINKSLKNVQFSYDDDDITEIILTFDDGTKVEITCEAPFAPYGSSINLQNIK
jgi:hypothetical protein